MSVYEILKNPSLDAGMVSAFPVTIIPQEEGYTRVLYNFDFDEVPGVLRKRYGTMRLYEPMPFPAKGAVQFLAEGIIPFYVAASGNQIVSEENNLWIAIQPPSWDDDSAQFCGFTSLLGQLVISDGVNTPFLWDGETATVLEDMPKGMLLANLRNRVFLAGDVDDPLKLSVSHTGDPSLWDPDDPASNAFSVYPGGDGAITGLLTVEDTLLIGKKYSLHSLVGTTVYDFQVIPIDLNIGIGSHWAAKHIRGAAYFVSSEGEIYRLEAGARPERLSGPVQDIVRQVNLSRIQTAVGAVMEKYHYVVTLPVGEVSWITLVYDIIRRRWRMSDLHMGTSTVSGEALGYCFTAPGGRQLFRLDPDSVDDDGEAVASHLETLEYHCGFPETAKEINNLWLGVWLSDEPFTLNIEAKCDGNRWESITPTGVLIDGNSNDYRRIRIPIGKTCYNIQFRISHEGAGEQVRLLDLLLTYIPKEME